MVISRFPLADAKNGVPTKINCRVVFCASAQGVRSIPQRSSVVKTALIQPRCQFILCTVYQVLLLLLFVTALL